MREEIRSILEDIYERFREGNFTEALSISEKASATSSYNQEVLVAIKCSIYWKERFEKADGIIDGYERAEFLFREWNGFYQRYSRRFEVPFEKGKNVIRQCLYSYISKIYESLFLESGKTNSDFLLKMGKCYKGMGNYEEAMEVLETALRLQSDNPDIWAQLADAHALVDEAREAKVLFREAFFLGAGKVDIDVLESDLVLRVVGVVKEEKPISDALVKEWIPVYGTLLGVFSVKRELRPLELGKIKQSVYKLREEIRKMDPNRMIDSVLVPRLINHYFWLIDHYIRVREDRGRVEEMLQYIKELDMGIWQRYIQ